jgi:DNA-directed RNA polymerase I subunit RPA2
MPKKGNNKAAAGAPAPKKRQMASKDPDEILAKMKTIVEPHIGSFNFMVDKGLPDAVANIQPEMLQLTPESPLISMWIEDVTIGFPSKSEAVNDTRLFPNECRERGLGYTAAMHGTICYRIQSEGNEMVHRVNRKMGQVPICVGSNRCHLDGLTSNQLVSVKEEPYEMGGYFICNGNERVIRMLQIPRRSYPMAIQRSSYKNRGTAYSDKGIIFRAVRPVDQSGVTLTLHYLDTGGVTARFSASRQEFFLPATLLLKALGGGSDRLLWEQIVKGETGNRFLTDHMELLLKDHKAMFGVDTKTQCRCYLGRKFRSLLGLPDAVSDEDVGTRLLEEYVLVHLDDDNDKAECLALMVRKLFSFVSGKCCADNADAPANQELLLPGHLYLMVLKEKMAEYLKAVKATFLREHRMMPLKVDLEDMAYVKKVLEKQVDIGKALQYLITTGNLKTSSGLDLMQVSGYSVVAEKVRWPCEFLFWF